MVADSLHVRLSRAVVILALAVAAIGHAATAHAQGVDVTELNLERLLGMNSEAVHDSSRYVDKISNAPASMTVVTGGEIRSYGFRTLADILRVIGGFYVTDDHNYSYIGTRGLEMPGDYNARLLVLVDGHRINDNVYDSVLAGSEFPLDVDLIARLEVIRGPGTAMYGANAFSAVINIVTVHGSRVDGLELQAEGGSLDTGRARVTYGRKLPGDGALLLSTTGSYSGGERHIYFPAFDTPETNRGVAIDADRDRTRQFFAELTFRDVVIRALHGGRRKQVPTASFGTVFNDGREQTYDGRGYVEAQYARGFGLSSDLLARVYYDVYRYDGRYPMPFDGAAAALSTDTSEGDAVGGELAWTRKAGERHHLVFGAEYRNNLRQNQGATIVDPFTTLMDDQHHSTALAFTAEDQIRVGRGFVASAAARFDQQSGFASRLTPRASLMIGPFAGTTAKLMLADAFRAPSAYERYYVGPLTTSANPTLGPESIRSLEALVEHRFTAALSGSVSWYRSILRDLIVPEERDGEVYQLINGWADVDGFEASASFMPGERWSAHASYAYQHPRDATTAERLGSSPRHLLKGRALFPIPQLPLEAGVHAEYVGRVGLRTGGTLGPSLDTGASVTTGGYWKRVQLGVTVTNLFDRAMQDPVSDEHIEESVPQYGRRFVVRLKWRP